MASRGPSAVAEILVRMLMHLLEQNECNETPGICHENATCSPVCGAERPNRYRCACRPNPRNSATGVSAIQDTAAMELIAKVSFWRRL